VTIKEARQIVRELTAMVESLRRQAMLHPDDAEASEFSFAARTVMDESRTA
jgi:hypothetical protein